VTLFENYSEDEVEKVLDEVGLLDTFQKLEGGIHSMIVENGRNLSGGEKQRLTLARTLLRKPPFILLDEYTANLDPASLEKIESCLFQLKDISVIVVSHRTEENYENYDHVIRIEDSHLIEIK
jgi:ABC-type multidrug transport system fused ATPase/permease subunit